MPPDAVPEVWSWQVTLGDLVGVGASGMAGGAGWIYARRQIRRAQADALRAELLALVRVHLRNTVIAHDMPVSPRWAELAELLPGPQARRLRTLLAGYRMACRDVACNELGERLYSDPRRVRAHLLLLVRLLRRPGL